MLAVAAFVLFLAAQASATPKATTCAVVTGAPFDFTIKYTHYSGDHYRVSATNVACSFAQTWVSRLTKSTPSEKAQPGGMKAMVGPSGWTCKGAGYSAVRIKPPTISGSCSAGGSSKQFHWGIDASNAQTPPVVTAG